MEDQILNAFLVHFLSIINLLQANVYLIAISTSLSSLLLLLCVLVATQAVLLAQVHQQHLVLLAVEVTFLMLPQMNVSRSVQMVSIKTL